MVVLHVLGLACVSFILQSYEYDAFSGSSSYNATRTNQGKGEQMMNTGRSILIDNRDQY